MADYCELEDKLCNDCGECDLCDLDNEKICDNCCKCIDNAEAHEYKGVHIDKVVVKDEDIFDV